MKNFQIHSGLAICIAIIYCTATADSVAFTSQTCFESICQDGPSTWSRNIPSLTITLLTTDFPSSTAAIVTAKYQLDGTEIAMCQIQLTGTTNQCNPCSPQLANFGVVCNRNTSSTVEIIITLGGLDHTRNQSKILLQQGSIPAADWNYYPNSTLITWDDCNLTYFNGAVAEDNSTCGYNCSRGFNCLSPVYTGMDFTRRWTALASWDDNVTTCSLACNNTYFSPEAEPVDDTIMGAGGIKTFNCTCQQPSETSQSFERTCGTDGNWINNSSSCKPVCSAARINCGTLTQSNSQTLLCGGRHYDFSCSTTCSGNFSLECGYDGTWNSTECYCPQVCSASNITCGTLDPLTNQTLCGGEEYGFSCNTACPGTFNLQCEFNGNWNSTDCDCSEGCSADDITCATLVQPTDQTVLCGERDYEFSCNKLHTTFNLQCDFGGNWNSTDCYCSEENDNSTVKLRASIASYVTSAIDMVANTFTVISSPLASSPTLGLFLKIGYISSALIYLGPIVSGAVLTADTVTSAYIAALVFISITTVCQIAVAVLLFYTAKNSNSVPVDITGMIGSLLVLIANIVLVATDTGSYELSHGGGVAGVVIGSLGGVLLIYSTVLNIMWRIKEPSEQSRGRASPEDESNKQCRDAKFRAALCGRIISK